MKKLVCVAALLVACGKKGAKQDVPATGSGSSVAPAAIADAGGAGSAAGSGSAGDTGAGSASATGASGASRADGDDLLSLANGTLVVHEPTGVDNSVHLWRLFDDDPKTDWGVEKDVIEKEPFVIEMGGRAQIDTFVIDVAGVELPDRMPGKIKIEVSDKSATDGFETVAELQPKQPAADNMTFPATKQVPGRWVRVTFYDAIAEDTTQQDIANLRAYGKRLSTDPAPDVTGTYQTNQGQISLKQTGTTVTGCRKDAKMPILGGLDGRVLKFNWPETDDGFEGPAIGVFGKDRAWMGFRATKTENHTLDEIIIEKKLSGKAEPCPGDKKDPIEVGLEAGRVRLYGINFDTDSDKLKSESTSTLDAVKKVLDTHRDWKITIEGHTDSTSTHEHNATLSDKRAAAVKAYLVKAGIAADRLDTSGLAETQPIAPNTDALGRAQNRRVELVKR